jgi:hypothetical protein
MVALSNICLVALVAFANAAPPVLDVYSHPKCKYCIELKAFITNHGFEYNDHPLGEDGRSGWAQMQKRAMACCEPTVQKYGPPEKGALLGGDAFLHY